jgi:hypothetical protein
MIAAIACIWAAVIALLVALYGWVRHVARTRELDRWGADFGVGRWEGETNRQYQRRISDRIDITGGKRNPW